MTTRRFSLRHIEAQQPIGPIYVVADGDTLVALDFGSAEGRLLRLLHARFGTDIALENTDAPNHIVSAMHAYLQGRFEALGSIPIDGGGSLFQRQVWTALRQIPVGETLSYGQLAANLGTPNAARAVGLANSLNPISIVIPCHRLIGSTGALTGYGGGIERKRWLLAHERGVV